jgi:hypothetical protein
VDFLIKNATFSAMMAITFENPDSFSNSIIINKVEFNI